VMEYLVKISEKARILELKRRNMKITVLTFYMPYPSRKIRRICACTSPKTTMGKWINTPYPEESIRCIQVMIWYRVDGGDFIEKCGNLWLFVNNIPF
ncbi:hypothetical protein Tco_1451387, partial [Tanacetum coccineum]